MHVINGRYKIIDTLYSDSVGTIYRVNDISSSDDITLRLKLLVKSYSHIDRVINIVKSFSQWKTIKHPYIDRVYDFDIVDTIDGKEIVKDRFFYTFEDRDYEQVIEYYDLKDDEKLSAISQLCKALAYLHSRGFVHGNLDFRTIVISRDINGDICVKLKNMVFLELYHDVYFNTGNNFVETVAPEIFFNENITKEADVYSLGILMYYFKYKGVRHQGSVDDINRRSDDDPFVKLVKKY